MDASPANVKPACCPEVLDVVLALMLLGRRRAQGTATCLPADAPSDPEVLDDVPPGVEAPPAELVLLPWLVVSLELVAPGLMEEPVLLPLGLVAEPVLLEPLELSERTAKSTLPNPGFMMTSLIVPSDVPELSLIWAPVNWLARSS